MRSKNKARIDFLSELYKIIETNGLDITDPSDMEFLKLLYPTIVKKHNV